MLSASIQSCAGFCRAVADACNTPAPAAIGIDTVRCCDAENRDQHRDRDLHRRQAEPLIGHLEDVALELAVGEHEHLALPGVRSRIRCRTSAPARRLQVDAEDVHRIVVPVAMNSVRSIRIVPC
jgi:hypothetical protein